MLLSIFAIENVNFHLKKSCCPKFHVSVKFSFKIKNLLMYQSNKFSEKYLNTSRERKIGINFVQKDLYYMHVHSIK